MEPDVVESLAAGEPPERAAVRLALAKARAVAPNADAQSCVLAADTLVVVDEEVLGKPRDADDAARMLLRLAGRIHRVVTGYAVLVPQGPHETGIELSRVHIRAVSCVEARAYAASGEPLDKAGGYAVQGEGGRFVEHIEGSRSNVIGLPLEAVLPALARLGVEPG